MMANELRSFISKEDYVHLSSKYVVFHQEEMDEMSYQILPSWPLVFNVKGRLCAFPYLEGEKSHEENLEP